MAFLPSGEGSLKSRTMNAMEGVGGFVQPAQSSLQQMPRRQMVQVELLCKCPDLLLQLEVMHGPRLNPSLG